MGGWNDTLCQISLCFFYAKKFHRRLVLDMEKYSGLRDGLENYFEFIDPNPDFIFELPSTFDFSGLTFYPEFIGSLDSYSMSGRFLKDTNKQVTFDFTKDYPHDILIHHTDGGGGDSFELLKLLKLKPDIAQDFENLIKKLPARYHATMVRNTDYKTDYVSHFNEIKSELNSEVLFLATDDSECLNYASQLFGEKLVSISQPPSNDSNQALIYNNFGMDLQKFYNRNSLIELLVSSHATKFHVSYIHSYKEWPLKAGSVSGFVSLAKILNDNKIVLGKLIGDSSF
jgi:hypothetical protein